MKSAESSNLAEEVLGAFPEEPKRFLVLFDQYVSDADVRAYVDHALMDVLRGGAGERKRKAIQLLGILKVLADVSSSGAG